MFGLYALCVLSLLAGLAHAAAHEEGPSGAGAEPSSSKPVPTDVSRRDQIILKFKPTLSMYADEHRFPDNPVLIARLSFCYLIRASRAIAKSSTQATWMTPILIRLALIDSDAFVQNAWRSIDETSVYLDQLAECMNLETFEPILRTRKVFDIAGSIFLKSLAVRDRQIKSNQ